MHKFEIGHLVGVIKKSIVWYKESMEWKIFNYELGIQHFSIPCITVQIQQLSQQMNTVLLDLE